MRLVQSRNCEAKVCFVYTVVTVDNVDLLSRTSGISNGTGEALRSESCKV